MSSKAEMQRVIDSLRTRIRELEGETARFKIVVHTQDGETTVCLRRADGLGTLAWSSGPMTGPSARTVQGEIDRARAVAEVLAGDRRAVVGLA